jgi:hypothetical protein
MKSADTVSVHLWYWLHRGLDGAELLRWARARGLERVVDTSLFGAAQIHYSAAPRFERPLEDPLPRRSGMLRGDRDHAVIVPPPPTPARAPARVLVAGSTPDEGALDEAAAIIRSTWPGESGGWHEAARALAGALLRLHWTLDQVEAFLRAAAPPRSQPRGDDEVGDLVRATATRIEAGAPATGWSRLRELTGEETVRGVRRLLCVRSMPAPWRRESTGVRRAS